jgi:hypothetical protein
LPEAEVDYTRPANGLKAAVVIRVALQIDNLPEAVVILTRSSNGHHTETRANLRASKPAVAERVRHLTGYTVYDVN